MAQSAGICKTLYQLYIFFELGRGERVGVWDALEMYLTLNHIFLLLVIVSMVSCRYTVK